MNVTEFRQQYPEYNDMTDTELGSRVYKKWYSDMPYKTFAERFGVPEKLPKVGIVESLKMEPGGAPSALLRRAPFSLLGLAEKLDIVGASRRYTQGEYPYKLKPPAAHFPGADPEMMALAAITPPITVTREQDIAQLEEYIKQLDVTQQRGLTLGAKVANIVSYMPGWMIEFIATGGISAAFSASGKAAAKRVLGRYAASQVGKAAVKTAGFAARTTGRAFVGMPHRAAKSIIERRVPGINIDETGNIVITKPTEKWASSIAKGMFSHWSEVATEEMGTTITKLLRKTPFAGKLFSKVKDEWLKIRPSNTLAKFDALFKAGKWDGPIGELGEERMNTILNSIANVQNYKGKNVFERVYAGLKDDLENIPAEAIAFSMIGGARFTGGKLLEVPEDYEQWMMSQTMEEGMYKAEPGKEMETIIHRQSEFEVERSIRKLDETILHLQKGDTSDAELSLGSLGMWWASFEGALARGYEGYTHTDYVNVQEFRDRLQKIKDLIKIENKKPPSKDKIALALSELQDIKAMYVGKTPVPQAARFKRTVSKLTTAIKEAEPVYKEQEKLRSAERGKRGGEYEDTLRSILSKTDDPRAARKAALSTLAGELPKADFTSISDKVSPQEINDLLQSIILNETLLPYEKEHLQTALLKVTDLSQVPTPSEVKILSKFFGVELGKALQAKRTLGRKIYSGLIESINLPRAILASYDLSAAGRQGIILLPSHPKIWAHSLATGAKAATNETYAEFYDHKIRTHKYSDLMRRSGIELTAWKGVGFSLQEAEEVYQTGLAEKIPGIRQSERAYVTTLNQLRANTFFHIAEEWEGTGKTMHDYKMLASFINHATGRGTFKKKAVKNFLPILNATFFSPKLLISRFQTVGDLVRPSQSWAVRKMVAADLASFVGTGLGVLWLLSMVPGVHIEKDPRSSDFGKITIGNTRMDFWGGYQQIARYLVQFMLGKRKASASGRISKADRYETFKRFLRSKMNPAVALPMDLLSGETFLGDKMSLEASSVMEQIYQRLTPLCIQDVADAVRWQGMESLSYVAPSAFFGINAQTYPETTLQEGFRVKNFYAQQTFGKKWDDIGNHAQKLLRTSYPQITELDERAKFERENYNFVGKIIEEQRAEGRKIQKALPKDIQTELSNIGFIISGMSRYIGSAWYLNDKRYNEYTGMTNKLLLKTIPKLMRTRTWNNTPRSIKRDILDELVKTVKKTVRQKIIDDSTKDDMVSLGDMIKKNQVNKLGLS